MSSGTILVAFIELTCKVELLCLAKMLIFIFLLATSDLHQSFTNAQDVNSLLPSLNECGVLNEDYLYNQRNTAMMDEFPWIGRIGFSNRFIFDSIDYRCLAVLISKRYILSPSHCLNDVNPSDIKHVLLGDWKTETDEDCDENAKCAPLPEKYEIEDIAFHPEYVRGKPASYDLTVMRLNRDVKFTDYIRPICLPPDNVSNDDFIAQQAVIAGFSFPLRNSNYPLEKIKAFAQVISLKRCKNLYNKENIADSGIICATNTNNYTFMSGSALMNFQVENSEPKRFYLIGMMSSGQRVHTSTSPDIYLRIPTVMDFIKNNIVN